MKIQNIRGLPPLGDKNIPLKRRIEASSKGKTDSIHLSSEAREKQSLNALVILVKKYLNKLPDIRKERVDAVSLEIKTGYRLDQAKLLSIAERIQRQMKI